MIGFLHCLQVNAEARDNAVGWQGKEEGQEGEEFEESSLKVGLRPTSHIYVFVNTFNLKDMLSFQLPYCILLCF